MKKINFCVGLFLMSLSSFAGDFGKTENQVLDSKSIDGNLEMVCCTRTGSASVSDGEGGSITVVKSSTGCTSLQPGESDTELCNAVQNEANRKALNSLSLMLP